MKILLFGLGSIGTRHRRNLLSLRPDAQVVAADPDEARAADYRDEWQMLIEHTDADGAIIASPTAHHAAQMQWLCDYGIPFLVEKPIGTIDELAALRQLVEVVTRSEGRCAVGFNYRFHFALSIKPELAKHLGFFGQDDLLARYGPDVGGIMVAHPIDTAIRLLGPPTEIRLQTDGVWLGGVIWHGRKFSVYDFHMGRGPRKSEVLLNEGGFPLPPDDKMYRDELAAWLTWLEGGERDPRLATLADGLRVTEVLAEVKKI